MVVTIIQRFFLFPCLRVLFPLLKFLPFFRACRSDIGFPAVRALRARRCCRKNIVAGVAGENLFLLFQFRSPHCLIFLSSDNTFSITQNRAAIQLPSQSFTKSFWKGGNVHGNHAHHSHAHQQRSDHCADADGQHRLRSEPGEDRTGRVCHSLRL